MNSSIIWLAVPVAEIFAAIAVALLVLWPVEKLAEHAEEIINDLLIWPGDDE